MAKKINIPNMFLLLLSLLSLSLLLPLPITASSFPTEQDGWGLIQNQPLLDNTYTTTGGGESVAAAPPPAPVPNNLGNSLGTLASQDPSAWWNQNQNQMDVKPPDEGSDKTGSSPSLLSFDASSSERPAASVPAPAPAPAAAESDNTFLLASTQATDSNNAALGLLLPSSTNDPNPVLNPSTPHSSDKAFSTTTDGSNPSLLALSSSGEEANPEAQTAGSSSTTSPSSPGSSIPPGTSNPSGEGQQQQKQQVALIGDEGDVGLPSNLLQPALGGDTSVIDLPTILKPLFNPKTPQPLSFPIRYNDKERLEDPQTPDCDEGMFPFCCNLGPPDPVDFVKNAHKRRDCRNCMF